MAQINGGQIQTRLGSFDGTTTAQNDLIRNQATMPAIREMLEIKNKRFFMTLLTSGAMGKWGIDYSKKTRIPQVKAGKLIGNNKYQFDVMSSIEQAATISSQVGASGADGSFQLLMADNYLYKNQVVRFKSGKNALVTSQPSASGSGYIYNFKVINGASFTFSTDVGSFLTCFPMHTAYSEGSNKSDSRNKKPDSYANYMTIQRKTAKITGGAESDVLWYKWASGENIGWLPIQVDQANTQFNAEGERQAIWGVSSMKNTDGTGAVETLLGNDSETGYPVITGDGLEEQVPSSNVLTASGVTGNATLSDFTDLMTIMQKSSNEVDGLRWVCFTGTEGLANVQEILPTHAAAQNITYFQQIPAGGSVAGGPETTAGVNFCNLNVNGNAVSFFVHPMMDRTDMFPALGNDGRSLMANTYYLIGVSDGNTPTLELLAKGANGVNRSFVQAEYGGLTGSSRTPLTEGDYDTVAMLKENVLCVYKPECCGIIYKAS